MKTEIYIPPSGKTAEKHLAVAFKRELHTLTTTEFVRAWCSLVYLYPGLHPDGFASRGNGWPKAFKPFAAEAWRRFEGGELTDNQLYCYQACKAGVLTKRTIIEIESSKKPWFFTDHFAA